MQKIKTPNASIVWTEIPILYAVFSTMFESKGVHLPFLHAGIIN
jgi:hypothetical protein